MRFNDESMAPHSSLGRVVVAVDVAVVGTAALLAWAPASPFDSDAARPESRYDEVDSFSATRRCCAIRGSSSIDRSATKA